MDFNPQLQAPDLSMARLEQSQTSVANKNRQLAAAQDFESVFIQMSLKSMRPEPSEDGLFNAGQAEQVFYQFMDEAVAKEVAKSPNNFGIADSMMKEYF